MEGGVLMLVNVGSGGSFDGYPVLSSTIES